MAVRVSGPRTDVDGLDGLEPIWLELHTHHLEVSAYEHLVGDPAASWTRRRDWYRKLLSSGAAFFTATDDRGGLVGYAMIGLEAGPDDTFDVAGGIAEVVSLVVSPAWRSAGVGRTLLAAAEEFARSRGFDTVKIAVMRGNARARRFYEASGYAVAEEVLYRRLSDARRPESG